MRRYREGGAFEYKRSNRGVQCKSKHDILNMAANLQSSCTAALDFLYRRKPKPFKHRVVDQENAEREHEVVEESVVRGGDDPHLERRHHNEAGNSKLPGQKNSPDKK